MSYWKGWPNKCPYTDDLKWACQIAVNYLRKIAPMYQKGGSKEGIIGLVIFDLDDTLFMGDPEEALGHEPMSLGHQKLPSGIEGEVFILPPNEIVVQVAHEAKKLGFKIICLTARPKESQVASLANLNMFKVPYNMLVMNDKDEDPYFKVKLRKKLALKPGQEVVCTVGDQFTDLYLPGGNTCGVKLPDPESKCSYVYVPR